MLLARIKWYDYAILAIEALALVPKKERSRFFRWLAHAGPDPHDVCKNCGKPAHEKVEDEEEEEEKKEPQK